MPWNGNPAPGAGKAIQTHRSRGLCASLFAIVSAGAGDQPPGEMQAARLPSKASRVLVDRLRRSKLYGEYDGAFRETAGLPLSLRSVEAFDLPQRGDPNENPFCALMAGTNQSWAACLQMQTKIEEQADIEPSTFGCFAGLCVSAVRVRIGKTLPPS
jgi:hypothetical protein